MEENRTAAVVVTYNRLAMLKKCLQSLLAQTAPCDILIVDNASTDGTGEWVLEQAEEEKKLHYRNTGANLGGAGGFQLGMRWAVQSGYEFIWVMDDDCFPKDDALEQLLAADGLLKGKYGWLSSVALWTDGHSCKMNHPKLKKNFYEYIEFMKEGIIAAEQATFVSLFLKTETVCQAGLPIAEFFIWGDDVEFTRRIAVRQKMPCFVVGKSQVVHAMKENVGTNLATDRPERIDRYRYAFRNEAYFYRKEGIRGIVYFCARAGVNFLRILIKAPDHKGKRAWVLISSAVRGCFFHPRAEFPEKANTKQVDG